MQSVQAQISLGEAASFSGGGGTRTSPTFIADYTVRALSDVVYFRVSRSLYYAARNATLLERAKSDSMSQRMPGDFDSELEQVFTTAANKDEADFAARVTTLNGLWAERIRR